MASNEKNSVNSIIDSLKEFNDKDSSTFTLPVSGLEVETKPLLAKHISKINSSLLAGSGDGSYTVRFTSLLKGLLEEILILPPEKTFRDFDIIDMHYIIFKIREQLNPNVKLQQDDGDDVEVDITKHIKALEKKKYKSEKTFGRKNCKITLKLPSFERHCKYNQIIEHIHTKISSDKKPDLEKLSTEVFAYTLIEFLYKLEVIVDKEIQEFNFHEESPATQMAILNNIPKQEYAKIFDTIGEMTEVITNATKTEYEDINIPIDHTLFID